MFVGVVPVSLYCSRTFWYVRKLGSALQQDYAGKWRCWHYLLISKDHFFHVIFGCGKITNTRVELLDLWGITYVVGLMGLPHINCLGDSEILSIGLIIELIYMY